MVRSTWQSRDREFHEFYNATLIQGRPTESDGWHWNEEGINWPGWKDSNRIWANWLFKPKLEYKKLNVRWDQKWDSCKLVKLLAKIMARMATPIDADVHLSNCTTQILHNHQASIWQVSYGLCPRCSNHQDTLNPRAVFLWVLCGMLSH